MSGKLKRWHKWLIGGIILLNLVIILVTWYNVRTHISPPLVSTKLLGGIKVSSPEKDFYTCENCWLNKNSSGLWELYIEGEPFRRGVIEGKLTRDLLGIQEAAFIGRLQQLVPSSFYQHFLKHFIYWFNRDIGKYISEEDKLQIYGISLSAPSRFSFMGSNYQRMLNYHSAHDIGHALVNMGMVGCTSFGVWGDKSATGNLIIGRNFDFYMGDEFAKNKIICFEKPDRGHPFMMITWPGMIGTVSGMNDKGLTVTINAAKSEIPWSARTPISILAREILQYAENISEARAIAGRHETFVSESILVGSREDNRAVILEKSPSSLAVVNSAKDFIICTNHFQSPEVQADPVVVRDMNENATAYRYRKVLEDITSKEKLDVTDVASVLRDRSGIRGEKTGMGNEKSINQLIAHHSVIFEPATCRVWVSNGPWQLGSFTCYDICKIIHNFAGLKTRTEIGEPDQMIPPDDFLLSADYSRFIQFRKMRAGLAEGLASGKSTPVSDAYIREFIGTNPDFFEVYELAGDHSLQMKRVEESCGFYRQALSKVIPRQKDRQRIIKKLAGCLVEIKK